MRSKSYRCPCKSFSAPAALLTCLCSLPVLRFWTHLQGTAVSTSSALQYH